MRQPLRENLNTRPWVKYPLGLWALFFLFFPAQGSAQAPDTETITLKFNDYFWYKMCSPQPFKGIRIHWAGLVDERPEKALALVTKKNGADPVEVYSKPPFQEILSGYLQAVFRQCGMKFEPEGGEGIYEISVSIKKFRAFEEKRLITGKGSAQSSLEIIAKLPGKKITSQIGYQIEFKQGRKSGIKRVKQILTELFQETLKEVINSAQLRSLKISTVGGGS